MNKALYFGFQKGAGHFLSDERGIVYDTQASYPGFPWDEGLLDGGLLRNGKVRDQPDGKVHWTAGGRALPNGTRDVWHAFYWWDRSGDRRSNCCSGFYVNGFGTNGLTAKALRKEAFVFACEQWPDIVARQAFPLELVQYPSCANCGRVLGKGSDWNVCPNELCEDAAVVLM